MIGDIRQFLKKEEEGYLLCDGRLVTKRQYPELYALAILYPNSFILDNEAVKLPNFTCPITGNNNYYIKVKNE